VYSDNIIIIIILCSIAQRKRFPTVRGASAVVQSHTHLLTSRHMSDSHETTRQSYFLLKLIEKHNNTIIKLYVMLVTRRYNESFTRSPHAFPRPRHWHNGRQVGRDHNKWFVLVQFGNGNSIIILVYYNYKTVYVCCL